MRSESSNFHTWINASVIVLSCIEIEYGFARVANAGIQQAVTFRKAAKQAGIANDAERDNPEAFVLTDSFPVARTPDQMADSKNFQNPFTGIRQIALTAKMINEAQ